jgi:hypothetical protein
MFPTPSLGNLCRKAPLFESFRSPTRHGAATGPGGISSATLCCAGPALGAVLCAIDRTEIFCWTCVVGQRLRVLHPQRWFYRPGSALPRLPHGVLQAFSWLLARLEKWIRRFAFGMVSDLLQRRGTKTRGQSRSGRRWHFLKVPFNGNRFPTLMKRFPAPCCGACSSCARINISIYRYLGHQMSNRKE